MPDIVFPNAYTHDTTNRRPFRRLIGTGLEGIDSKQNPAVNNPNPSQPIGGGNFEFTSVNGVSKSSTFDSTPVTDSSWIVPTQASIQAPAVYVPRELVVPYDRTPPADYEEPFLIIRGYLQLSSYTSPSDTDWRPIATYCSRGLYNNVAQSSSSTLINFLRGKVFSTYTIASLIVDTSTVGIGTDWAMANDSASVTLTVGNVTWFMGDGTQLPAFSIIISGKN